MFNVTLQDLKAFLGYDTSGSPTPVDARDPTLTMYLNAGFATLKRLTGRNLEYKLYRDTLAYQPQRVHLREWPVSYVYAVQRGGVDLDPSEYQVFMNQGYVYFKNQYRHFREFGDQTFLTIDYVAGYEELPADMLLAVFSAIQGVDVAQKSLATSGGIVKRVSVYDVGVTDYYIPKEGSTSSQLQSTMEPLLGSLVSITAPELGAPDLHEVEVLGDVGIASPDDPILP